VKGLAVVVVVDAVVVTVVDAVVVDSIVVDVDVADVVVVTIGFMVVVTFGWCRQWRSCLLQIGLWSQLTFSGGSQRSVLTL